MSAEAFFDVVGEMQRDIPALLLHVRGNSRKTARQSEPEAVKAYHYRNTRLTWLCGSAIDLPEQWRCLKWLLLIYARHTTLLLLLMVLLMATVGQPL